MLHGRNLHDGTSLTGVGRRTRKCVALGGGARVWLVACVPVVLGLVGFAQPSRCGREWRRGAVLPKHPGGAGRVVPRLRDAACSNPEATSSWGLPQTCWMCAGATGARRWRRPRRAGIGEHAGAECAHRRPARRRNGVPRSAYIHGPDQQLGCACGQRSPENTVLPAHAVAIWPSRVAPSFAQFHGLPLRAPYADGATRRKAYDPNSVSVSVPEEPRTFEQMPGAAGSRCVAVLTVAGLLALAAGGVVPTAAAALAPPVIHEHFSPLPCPASPQNERLASRAAPAAHPRQRS